MSRLERDATHWQDRVEIGQDNRYINCTFRECSFTGTGPVEFDGCTFDKQSYNNLVSAFSVQDVRFEGKTTKID